MNAGGRKSYRGISALQGLENPTWVETEGRGITG